MYLCVCSKKVIGGKLLATRISERAVVDMSVYVHNFIIMYICNACMYSGTNFRDFRNIVIYVPVFIRAAFTNLLPGSLRRASIFVLRRALHSCDAGKTVGNVII